MPEFIRITATAGALVESAAGAAVDQTGLTAQPGPGATPLGELPDAVRFGSAARASLASAPALADRERFAMRVVFAARGAVTGRQNLIESTDVPATLWIEPAPGDAGSIRMGAAVRTPSGAWRFAEGETALAIDAWHTVALVVDDDVLGIVDETGGTLVAAAALPEALLGPSAGPTLALGVLPDGTSAPFAGDLAAAVWTDELPAALDALVNDWRLSAAGMIEAKRWSLPFDPGAPVGPPQWHPASLSTASRFAHADIRFSEDAGHAFEMHGAIRDEYDALTYASLLGFPVSDEVDGRVPGLRKNLFSQGAIYWTQPTGAFGVFEEFYASYEALGEATMLGAPTEAEEEVAGGLVQRFENGELYLADGATTAFETHGAILARFLETGGVATWGLPTTDEQPILAPGGAEIGRYSRFGGAGFYWSVATGAHVVYGAIGDHYLRVTGGPQGRLGFPTSDEFDLPDAPGARCSTFEHGSVLWYPDTGIVEPAGLRVKLGTVDTKEDEGLGRGQNDLTIDVGLLRDGVQVDGFQDVSDGHNIRPLDRELSVPLVQAPGVVYTLRVDVHERDPEDRPRLGLWEKRLDAGNGWGMREANGILNSGGFSMIKGITASVAPLPPAGGFSDADKHWGFAAPSNPSTAEISRTTFATAFPDVDSEPEWWDIGDGLESVFYELVSKGLSANGNCMGFSAEGIRAEVGSSIYQLPLSRFGHADWPRGLEKTINVRHQSQVGADAVWAFVGMFLSGNTHDPVDVFRITRDAHAAGQPPVLCLAQNADFSGAPHVVRPIHWRQNGSAWEIDVLDPNFAGGPRVVHIDADANAFRYDGASDYSGGEWSGGRLYFLPFDTFAGSARLPVWDAVRLILGGTIAIMGDGDAATGITTPDGENLLLTGEPTRDARHGAGANGFVPVPAFARRIGPGDLGPRRGPVLGGAVITDASRAADGIRFGDLIGDAILTRAAASSNVLARARREPSRHRRGPRGIHRRIRDIVTGIEVPEYIAVPERPHREELKKKDLLKTLTLEKLRLDVNPMVLANVAAPAVVAPVAAPAGVPVAAVVDATVLRGDLAALAERMPAGDAREAVVRVAATDLSAAALGDALAKPGLDAGIVDDLGGIIRRLLDDDFVLDTVSTRQGAGRIAIATGLRGYVIGHDGARGSALRVAGKDLRTARNTLSIAPGTARRVSLTVTNRIGLAGDVVRARFVDLPAESAAPIALNVRPGSARWELAGDTLQGPARAEVSGILGGRRFRADYDLTLQSALRIRFPLATDAARLSVATTAGLFADAVDLTTLAPR